jgi:hypothetical protein
MNNKYLVINLDMWKKCFTLEWYTFFTNLKNYYKINFTELLRIKHNIPINSIIIFVEIDKNLTNDFCKNNKCFKFIYWCDDIHHDLRVYNVEIFQLGIPFISCFGNSLKNSFNFYHYAQDLYFKSSPNRNPINKILITGTGYVNDSIYGFRNFIFKKATSDNRIDVLPHHLIYDYKYARYTNKYIANITSTLNKVYHYIFAKVFEITAVGSLLVIEDTIEDDLKEVGFYHKVNCFLVNKHNIDESMNYILDLNNRKEIDRIRKKGYLNTKKNHTLNNRLLEFNQLINKIDKMDNKYKNFNLELKYK